MAGATAPQTGTEFQIGQDSCCIENLSSDDGACILFAKNSSNQPPLISAVKHKAGGQVIEALLNCTGTEKILLDQDHEHNQTILQLTIGREECYESFSIASILNAAPQLAHHPSLGQCPSNRWCLRWNVHIRCQGWR